MATRSFDVEDGECAGRNNEEDEGHDEANHLHPLAPVVLVVDEKRCEVIADQLAPDID